MSMTLQDSKDMIKNLSEREFRQIVEELYYRPKVTGRLDANTWLKYQSPAAQRAFDKALKEEAHRLGWLIGTPPTPSIPPRVYHLPQVEYSLKRLWPKMFVSDFRPTKIVPYKPK